MGGMGTITGLAQRFQESRVRAGLTKTALARPRYTVSYVSQIEAGRRSPSPRRWRSSRTASG